MMRRLSLAALVIGAIATLSGCGGSPRSIIPNQQTPSFNTARSSAQRARLAQIVASTREICPSAAADEYRCIGSATTMLVKPVTMNPATTPGTCTLDINPCLGPMALQTAYNIVKEAAANGSQSTVGIVDSGSYPTAKSDNAKYRAMFGLPAGNLTIVNQNGKPSPLPSKVGDTVEQDIDLTSVSALCPLCHIVLVESNSGKKADTDQAEKTALAMADVVSNSFGRGELEKSNTLWDDHPGKIITASAGDAGARGGVGKDAVIEPCAYKGVICVGGTRLTMTVIHGVPSRVDEVVWNDLGTPQCPSGGKCATSSGCSTLVVKPSWQHDIGCTMRAVSDVSADAVDELGVINGKCCTIFRGTSVSSPLVAAMFGLAGQTKAVSAKTIYQQGGWNVFNDITSGTNEFEGRTYMCPKVIRYLCFGGRGYDGPTGWGTPNGVGAFTKPPSS